MVDPLGDLLLQAARQHAAARSIRLDELAWREVDTVILRGAEALAAMGVGETEGELEPAQWNLRVLIDAVAARPAGPSAELGVEDVERALGGVRRLFPFC